MVDAAAPTSYWLTRFVFQRALAVIYLMGFLAAANQWRGLCGDRGILPVRLFLDRVGYRDAPSLFHLYYSDRFAMALAWAGVALALLAISGLSDAYGLWLSIPVWFSLWALYLTFVNVGQTWYAFGWESLLLETGFLAIFLGPSRTEPPVIVIWLLRWILFRLMFGAGMIKIRGDECWRDLTCMKYHWETQPMPNPLTWYFNLQPMWMNKGAVLINHFVELVVPFFLFGPRLARHWAGGLTAGFMFILVLSGNLSWLNWLTIVLALACFDDSFWSRLLPESLPTAYPWVSATAVAAIPSPVIWAVGALIVALSIRPAMNLVSRQQIMNTSFDSLHLVNTYGAFGSITRERYEVAVEGTNDPLPTTASEWREYQFKGKPSDPMHMPPQVAPYHLRIDWLMWFAAMGPYYQYPWTLSFAGRLLQGSEPVLALLRENPFPDKPPRFVRMSLYRYRLTRPGDGSPGWWKREREGVYLPPLSLAQPEFQRLLEENGWL